MLTLSACIRVKGTGVTATTACRRISLLSIVGKVIARVVLSRQKCLASLVSGQDVESPPFISIDGYQLEAVDTFKTLRSTIAGTLSLDAERNTRIGKAATTIARLQKSV